MPQETDRLKLPLPLGNENVTRESINGIFEKIDAGVATQADLDTLREAVSKMDIPDASLTQKGKVQLSSKTDGTSETVAATEKAVRDARVAAINAAATDATTKANAAVAPIIGASSPNVVKNSAGNLGLYGWTNVGTSYWLLSASPLSNKGFNFFYINSIPANGVAMLDSDGIPALAGTTLTLQAMFNNPTTSSLYLSVFYENIPIAELYSLNSTTWHRRTVTFTVPSGITSLNVRLVALGGTTGSPANTKGITRIKLSEGSVDVPFTTEGDDIALYERFVKQNVWGAL